MGIIRDPVRTPGSPLHARCERDHARHDPPGLLARRVWVHPEVKSHSLVVLTFDRLHVAPLAGGAEGGTARRGRGRGDLEDLLGPLAVVVELISVQHLKLDLLSNALVVEYANGLGTSRLTVVFAGPEAADLCFTKLWRRLGDGYKLRPYQRDPWTLARGPLVMLVGVLVATAALALTLSAFEDMASARAVARLAADGKALPKTPLEYLLGWMSWRVCAAGGVAAGASQVWLYRKLTRPPVSLEVTKN
ncbi:hypothetical protein J8F10_22705 [Gemmata sp. G18]|uniref:Uncharacterized protein n=1 Tax=Gemmata palustris TaxID=2822762 RepID=A0ABS5BWF9_9BACT|nr:hypothetical protein [Gemmata palustris]MBP3958074.1 hypothetical protein [Gemmata palustris]